MKWTSVGKVDVDKEVTQIWMNRFLPPNDSITFNFAIEELANPGRTVGVLGCHKAEPPEIGYMLRTESWGKGYASEALRLWLDAWWELPREDIVIEDAEPIPGNADNAVPEVLRADIDSKNAASARILARCGFRPVSEELVEENGVTIKMILLDLQRPN